MLWLAVLSPNRAAAELPLLSLGAKADDEILTDGLVGSHQLGLHVRTATRTTEDAGLGPSVGLTVSREFDPPKCMCLNELRTTVMSPSTGQLQVPLRASLGLQTRFHGLHFMLVGRGGWDDIRLGFGPRPVAEVTLAIGLIRFL